MIFISCSFDPFSMPYGEQVFSLFEEYGVKAYLAKHPASGPLPQVLKSDIERADALVALVTDRVSRWQETEITWAHDLKKPIYGIVQKDATVGGLLPYVTKYIEFAIFDPESLNEAITETINSISEMKDQLQQRNLLIAGIGLLALAAAIGISQSK